MERAGERGSSRGLQFWRLVLLLGFGLFHFYLIWFGDILAMYALIGCLALLCMRLKPGTQIRVGLFVYTLGCIFFGGIWLMQYLIVDTPVFEGQDWVAQARSDIAAGFAKQADFEAKVSAHMVSGDYAALIAERFQFQALMPFKGPLFGFPESFSLMLIGMGLYRQGFFNGAFTPAKMKLWGWIGVVIGGGLTLALAVFVQSEAYTPIATNAAFFGWSMAPRLMMVLGLAALMVEYSKSASGWLAQRISAAGRVAFTNYLGTSIVMMVVFQGWGIGLYGQLNRPLLYLVTLLAWCLMLAWSKPWLERYRYGPLEWLWRCLTYRKLFPLRRET